MSSDGTVLRSDGRAWWSDVLDVGPVHASAWWLHDAVRDYAWESCRVPAEQVWWFVCGLVLFLTPAIFLFFICRAVLVRILRHQGHGEHVQAELACVEAFREVGWISDDVSSMHRVCAYCKGYPEYEGKKTVHYVLPAARCDRHMWRPAFTRVEIPEAMLRSVYNSVRRYTNERTKDPTTDVQLSVNTLELAKNNLTAPSFAAECAHELAVHVGIVAALRGWVLGEAISHGHVVHDRGTVHWQHVRLWLDHESGAGRWQTCKKVGAAIFSYFEQHEDRLGPFLFAADRICDTSGLLCRTWAFAGRHCIEFTLLGIITCGHFMHAICAVGMYAASWLLATLVSLRLFWWTCTCFAIGSAARVLFRWARHDGWDLHAYGIITYEATGGRLVQWAIRLREDGRGCCGQVCKSRGWVVLRCITACIRIPNALIGDAVPGLVAFERYLYHDCWRPRHCLFTAAGLNDPLLHAEHEALDDTEAAVALEASELSRVAARVTYAFQRSGAMVRWIGSACWRTGSVACGRCRCFRGRAQRVRVGDLLLPLFRSGDRDRGSSGVGQSPGSEIQLADGEPVRTGVGEREVGSDAGDDLENAHAVRPGTEGDARLRMDDVRSTQDMAPSASGNENTSGDCTAAGILNHQNEHRPEFFDISGGDVQVEGVGAPISITSHAGRIFAVQYGRAISRLILRAAAERVPACPEHLIPEDACAEDWPFPPRKLEIMVTPGAASEWHDNRSFTYDFTPSVAGCQCMECAVRASYAKCQANISMDDMDIGPIETVEELDRAFSRVTGEMVQSSVSDATASVGESKGEVTQENVKSECKSEVMQDNQVKDIKSERGNSGAVSHTETATAVKKKAKASAAPKRVTFSDDCKQGDGCPSTCGEGPRLVCATVKSGAYDKAEFDKMELYDEAIETYKGLSFAERLQVEPGLRDRVLAAIDRKQRQPGKGLDAAELRKLRYTYGEKVLGYCLGSPHLHELYQSLERQRNPHTVVAFANREIKADKKLKGFLRDEARALKEARLMDDEEAIKYCGVQYQGRALLPAIKSKLHIADGMSAKNEMAAACGRHFCRVDSSPLSPQRRAKIQHVAKEFAAWVCRNTGGFEISNIQDQLPKSWTEDRIRDALNKAAGAGFMAKLPKGKFFVKNNEALQKLKPRGISGVDDYIVVGHACYLLQVEDAMSRKHVDETIGKFTSYFLRRTIKKATNAQLSARFAEHVERIATQTAARRGADEPEERDLPFTQSIDFGSWDARVRAHLRECESILYQEMFWCLEKRGDSEHTALFHRMAERLCLQGNFIVLGTSDYGRQSGDRGTSTLNAVINLILDFVLEWEFLAVSKHKETREKYSRTPGDPEGWTMEGRMEKREGDCEWDFMQEGDDNSRFISADFLRRHVARPQDSDDDASRYFHKCCLAFYTSLGMVWEPATTGGRIAADGTEGLLPANIRMEFCSRHQVLIPSRFGVSGLRCVSFPKLEKALTSASISFSKMSLRPVAMSTFGALAASACNHPLLHGFALAARHFYARYYEDEDEVKKPDVFLALSWAAGNLKADAEHAGVGVEEYIELLRADAVAQESDRYVRDYTAREYPELTIEKQISLEESCSAYCAAQYHDVETAWQNLCGLYEVFADAVGN